MTKAIAIAVVSCLVIALIIVLPILAFWSLDVLFDYQIELTFKTWLAMFVLLALVGGKR